MTYHLNKTRAIIDNSIGLIATLAISLAIGFSFITNFSQTTAIIALIITPIMIMQWRLLYYGIKKIFVSSPLLKIDSTQLIDSTWANGKSIIIEFSDITDVTLFYAKGPRLKVVVSNFEKYNDQLSQVDLFVRKLNPKLKSSFVISLKYVKEHPEKVLTDVLGFLKPKRVNEKSI